MRILLSKDSKKELLNHLKTKHSVDSLFQLSNKLKIPTKTLSEWFYNKKRYIPEEMILKEIRNKLKILDKKEDNWGRVKGGKKAIQIIIRKYGYGELEKRRRKGVKNSLKKRGILKPLNIKIEDPLFLEFYGILMGDGWLSRLRYKNKINHLIGISGHMKLDRAFFNYCQSNVQKMFNRKAYIKEIPKDNNIQFLFSHKSLNHFLEKELEFPVGKKGENLKIPSRLNNLGFEKIKYLIRGIFDTDGSFYLDKTPVGNLYPCISIQMKAPILIKQLYNILIKQGFRVVYREKKNMITLKGSIQLKKWMKEIGSSNPKHLNKINAFVAQSGIRARPS